LVKLLGDGAMLHLTDASAGVDAAMDLVETMSGEGALSSHAGVHVGSVIERDLDVFGQTVNLASRIADVAVLARSSRARRLSRLAASRRSGSSVSRMRSSRGSQARSPSSSHGTGPHPITRQG
jgi:class 3 adenylate cyclase